MAIVLGILHVLFTILKFIALLLLWMIGIILFLLILILAAPISYEAKASYQEKVCVKARVRWLYRIVSVCFALKDGQKNLKVSLFGLQIFPKKEKKAKKKKKKKNLKKADQIVSEKTGSKTEASKTDEAESKEALTGEGVNEALTGESVEQALTGESVEQALTEVSEEVSQENAPAGEAVTEETGALEGTASEGAFEENASLEGVSEESISGGADSDEGVSEGVYPEGGASEGADSEEGVSDEDVFSDEDDLKDDFSEEETGSEDEEKGGIKEMLKKGYDFINEPSVKKLIGKLLKSIKKIIKHLLPRELNMEGCVGLDDPATTGKIMEAAAILYSIYGDHVRITGDFEEKILKGKVSLKGRIVPGYLVLKVIGMALRVILNKECRALYREIRNNNK